MVDFWLGVLGNMVAALIAGVPAYLHHHRTGARRHAEQLDAHARTFDQVKQGETGEGSS